MVAGHEEQPLAPEAQPLQERFEEAGRGVILLREPPIGHVAGDAHEVDRALGQQLVEVARPRVAQHTIAARAFRFAAAALMQVGDVQDAK